AERFCADPAMRNVVGGRAKSQAAASTSEMARFETEILSHLAESTGGKRLSCSGWVERGHGSISIGWESWLCLPPNGRVHLPGRRQETWRPETALCRPGQVERLVRRLVLVREGAEKGFRLCQGFWNIKPGS